MTNSPRRRAIAATLTAVLLATTAACGRSNPDSEPTEPPPTTSSPLDYNGSVTPPAPSQTPYITPSIPLPPATGRPTDRPGTPGRTGTPRGLSPAAANPDRSDPNAVAAAFSLTLTSYDTRLDNQPADAGRRAATFAIPALATELRQPPPGGNPGAAWRELKSHNGYTQCTATDATEAGAPTDTPTQASRAIQTTCRSTGDNNWSADNPTQVLYLTLSKVNKQWFIASYDVQ
ncbi:hypothetical protein ACIA49_39070 [Kribbella sp. NPDC051587]|uniref:hypothetical protein n=1 Tax=Kribbella sp. NPDC051587 TaxID=3364119 RepID=UPI0037B662B8